MSDDQGPLALGPKQRRSIAQATARVNIWHGSVSSGKTVASIIAWLDYLARDCPARGELLMHGTVRAACAGPWGYPTIWAQWCWHFCR